MDIWVYRLKDLYHNKNSNNNNFSTCDYDVLPLFTCFWICENDVDGLLQSFLSTSRQFLYITPHTNLHESPV